MGRVTTVALKDPTSVWILPPDEAPTDAGVVVEGFVVTEGLGVGMGVGNGEGVGEGVGGGLGEKLTIGDGEGEGSCLGG